MLVPLTLAAGVLHAQTLHLKVVADKSAEVAGFVVTTEWLGEAKEARLASNTDEPVAGRLFVGELKGEEARALAIHLWALDEAGQRTEISASFESLGTGDDTLIWNYGGVPPRARRVAIALPGRSVEMAESTSVAASLGWLGLVLAYAGWLVRRRSEAL
jgi:hypothetical protein